MTLQQFDRSSSQKIQATLSGKDGPSYGAAWIRWFWETLSAKGAYLYGFVVMGLMILIDDKHRLFIWLAPVVLTALITFVLQAMIRRPRPIETKTTYKLFVHTFSFPSAHASTSFAFATSLSLVFLQSHLEFSWLFAIGFFLLAFLIASSRVVVGVHYFFDIVAGALLGIAISLFLL